MRRMKFEFCVWIRELKIILARCRAALAPKWCNISPQLLVRGHTQHVGRHALRRAQRYGPLFNYFLCVFSRVLKPECALAGIDLYDGEGTKIAECGARSMKIMANPADINVLPGCCLLYSALPHLRCNCIDRYKNDPRTVDKLLDGVNRTCDDLHMWLAPFTRHVTGPQILHSKAQTSKNSPPSLQRPASLRLHRPRSRHDTQSHQVFCTFTVCGVTFFLCVSFCRAEYGTTTRAAYTRTAARVS